MNTKLIYNCCRKAYLAAYEGNQQRALSNYSRACVESMKNPTESRLYMRKGYDSALDKALERRYTDAEEDLTVDIFNKMHECKEKKAYDNKYKEIYPRTHELRDYIMCLGKISV